MTPEGLPCRDNTLRCQEDEVDHKGSKKVANTAKTKLEYLQAKSSQEKHQSQRLKRM